MARVRTKSHVSNAEVIKRTDENSSTEWIFYLLCFITLMDSLAWGFVNPTLQTKQQQMGFTIVESGWLTSVYCTVTFITTPTIGMMSDKLSRKICLLCCVVVSGFGALLCGITNNTYIYVLGRILTSAVKCVNTLCQAYVVDMLDGTSAKDKSTKAIDYSAKIMTLWSMAYMVGPVVGGYLSKIDMGFPWFASALCQVTNTALALCLPMLQKKEQEQEQWDDAIVAQSCSPSNSDKNGKKSPGSGGKGDKKLKKLIKKEIKKHKNNTNSEAWNSLLVKIGPAITIKFLMNFGYCLYDTQNAQFIMSAQEELQITSPITTIGNIQGILGLVGTITNAFLVTPLVVSLDGSYANSCFLMGAIALMQAIVMVMWGNTPNIIWLAVVSGSAISLNTFFYSLQTHEIREQINSGIIGSCLVLLVNVDRAARILAAPTAAWIVSKYGFLSLGITASFFCGGIAVILIVRGYYATPPMKKRKVE